MPRSACCRAYLRDKADIDTETGTIFVPDKVSLFRNKLERLVVCIAVARNSHSRIFETVVNLCTLANGWQHLSFFFTSATGWRFFFSVFIAVDRVLYAANSFFLVTSILETRGRWIPDLHDLSHGAGWEPHKSARSSTRCLGWICTYAQILHSMSTAG